MLSLSNVTTPRDGRARRHRARPSADRRRPHPDPRRRRALQRRQPGARLPALRAVLRPWRRGRPAVPRPHGALRGRVAAGLRQFGTSRN